MFAFTHLLDQDSDYDVITGVSVGSINSFGLALTEKGDFNTQANILGSLWSTLKQSDVFRGWWPFGILQGLIAGNSLFNYRIDKYLDELVNRLNYTELKRPILIGAANVGTGRFDRFTNEDIHDFIQGVRGSSSIPAAFNPTIINGNYLIDGGTVEYMMPTEAITMCQALGFEQNEINLDLIMIENAKFHRQNMTGASFVQNLVRLSEIRNYYQVMGSVIKTMFAYPNVNYRYLVRPSGLLDVDELIPINFTQDHIQQLIAMGDAEAVSTYARGPGTVFDELIEELTGEKRGWFGGLNLKGTSAAFLKKAILVDGQGRTIESFI